MKSRGALQGYLRFGGVWGEAPRMWSLIYDQIACDQMLGDQIVATKLLGPIVVDPGKPIYTVYVFGPSKLGSILGNKSAIKPLNITM